VTGGAKDLSQRAENGLRKNPVKKASENIDKAKNNIQEAKRQVDNIKNAVKSPPQTNRKKKW
jgi:hypothetical protein